MVWPVDGVRRTQLVLAILFLVACIGYLVAVNVLGIETEVMRDRFWLNAEPMAHGVIPDTEYPPLALLFIAIPRIFADTPFGYNVAFVAEIFLFMVAGLLLTSRLAGAIGRDRCKAMVSYSILVLLMLEFVVDRFDIIPAIMTLGALYLFMTGRVRWAFVLLALGTLTKLYPAILFPVMLLYLVSERRWRDAAEGAVAFVGTGLLALAICWVVDPELILGFLGYHGDRPLQLESVASSIVYLVSMLGLTDVWIQPSTDPGSFLSDNLRGPLPDTVAEVLMPLMVVAIIAVCALYAYRRLSVTSEQGMRMAALAMLGCLMAFLVTNKVFSSQYLIWAIAPIAFVVASRDTGFERRLLWLSVLVLVLTQANFAYNAGYLGGGENINDLGMMVILARNVLAVWLTCMVLGGMRRPAGDAVPSPPESDPVERRVIISRRAR